MAGQINPTHQNLWACYDSLVQEIGSESTKGHWFELQGKNDKGGIEEKAVQVFTTERPLAVVHFEGYNNNRAGNVYYSLWPIVRGQTTGSPYFDTTDVKYLGSEAQRLALINRIDQELFGALSARPLVSLVIGYLSSFYERGANIFLHDRQNCTSLDRPINFSEFENSAHKTEEELPQGCCKTQ